MIRHFATICRTALLAALPVLIVGCGGVTHGDERASNVPGSAPLDANSDLECGRILDGDLFSKVTQSSSSVERDLAQLRFFTLPEDEAWSAYQTAKRSSPQGEGDVGVSVIAIVDVAAGGSGGPIEDFATFKPALARAGTQFNQYISTDRYKNATNSYTSLVRDAASVTAWSECISAASAVPKFRMVLKRQNADAVDAQVIYFAGASSGRLPQLKINFTGATFQSAEAQQTISHGSELFPLAIAAGTEAIGVNGATLDGNTKFSFFVALPPTRDVFEGDRCRLQNALMLMLGKVSQPIYNALELANYVAFPVRQAPQGHGSEACSAWLVGM